jgi:hypothetical protein
VTMSSNRLKMVRGCVALRTRCTTRQSRISNGLVYGIAVIRSFQSPRSFRYVLEGVAENGILLIRVCASGVT